MHIYEAFERLLMGLNAKTIVMFAVALVVMSAILPSAISNVEDANTTGWSTGATSMWGIIGIVAVAGIVIGIVTAFMRR